MPFKTFLSPDQNFHPVWQKLSFPLLLIALVLGVYFRVEMYLFDRPFVMNTAGLADNIVSKDYLQLMGQLYGFQAAPIGFLYLSKLIGSLRGYSELSLTFAPMVFSLGSLVLFLILSLKVLGKSSAAAAFLPFALCSSAIHKAGEFKQYSCELFFCVLILYFAYRILETRFSNRAILLFTIAGVISTLFSYSAIFVTAGTGISLFITSLVNKQYRKSLLLMAAGIVILVHFLLWYFLQIQHNSVDRFTISWTKRGGFPPAGFGLSWFGWWLTSFRNYINTPLGFVRHGVPVATLLFALGFILAILVHRTRAVATLFLGPLMVLVLATSLHKYPFVEQGERLILFSVPLGFILIALAAKHLSQLLRYKSQVMAVLLIALAYPQLNALSKGLPGETIDARSLYNHLSKNFREGDIIYVTNKSQTTFSYYNRKHNLPVVYGSSLRGDQWIYDLDPYLDSENSNRIWIVITHGSGGRALTFMHILYDGNGWAITQENFENAWLLLSSPENPFPPGWQPGTKTKQLKMLEKMIKAKDQ